MRFVIRYFMLLPLLFSVSLWAQAISPHQAVENATKDLLATIERERPNFKDKPDQFFTAVQDVLLPFIDFDTIARRVMGQYYAAATPEQRSAFAEAFRNSLIKTYTKGLLEYNNEEIVVLPAREGDRRGNRARVQMEIRSATGATYPVTYSMYESEGGQWLLENVTINGINIGLTFRNQFTHAVRMHKGNIDKVIANWSAEIGGGEGTASR